MVLQSSGLISLNSLKNEFVGTTPIQISDYYANSPKGYATGATVGTNGTTLPYQFAPIFISYFYGKAKATNTNTVPTPVQTTFSGTYAWVGGGYTYLEWVTGCSGSNLSRTGVSTFDNRYSQGAGRSGALYYPDLILQARAGDTIRFIVSMSNGINADHEYIRAWINLGGGYYQIGNTLDTYGGNTLTVDYTIPVGTPAGNYALCGMNDYAYYDSYYRSVNYYSLHIW